MYIFAQVQVKPWYVALPAFWSFNSKTKHQKNNNKANKHGCIFYWKRLFLTFRF